MRFTVGNLALDRQRRKHAHVECRVVPRIVRPEQAACCLACDGAGRSALPAYPVASNSVVEKIEYRVPPDEPDRGRVHINGTQYFDSVPPDMWQFHVGGYQVCQKWLKDRKGRALSYEDITHYQCIVAALAEMIALMEQIDRMIEEYEGWPIKLMIGKLLYFARKVGSYNSLCVVLRGVIPRENRLV